MYKGVVCTNNMLYHGNIQVIRGPQTIQIKRFTLTALTLTTFMYTYDYDLHLHSCVHVYDLLRKKKTIHKNS